jgi:hypothetical protein
LETLSIASLFTLRQNTPAAIQMNSASQSARLPISLRRRLCDLLAAR